MTMFNKLKSLFDSRAAKLPLAPRPVATPLHRPLPTSKSSSPPPAAAELKSERTTSPPVSFPSSPSPAPVSTPTPTPTPPPNLAPASPPKPAVPASPSPAPAEVAKQPEKKPSSAAEAPKPVAPKAASTAVPPAPSKKPNPAVFTPTPEQLCNISPNMTPEQVRQRLAMLYRRYNHASSSLNAGLRVEAEAALNAIVAVREKYFGPV